MLKVCPDPVDVQDIQFKLHCRLKVFDNKDVNTFPYQHSLISCASRYGLLFIGSNTANLQAVQLKCIENYSVKDRDISNYPRRNLSLPSSVKHISVNCDSTILAVVVVKDSCPTVIFYDVLSFYKQTVAVLKELRLSATPGVAVTEVNWNPALSPIFTACKSDGTLGVYEIKGNSVDINELPPAAETTCFCWSPKGKQIAVGSKNGKITQYKPDLKAMKIINEPPLSGPHSLIALQWVSNFQFIGVYQSTEPEGQAKLVVVDSPKTGHTSYTNYEDICYSGTSRGPQFYMILQQHWNLLMVASANSSELGVLGGTSDTWTQWIISDSARAELPLSSDKQETLPVGLALDISPTAPLPWGEGTLPPCPFLLILSHYGVLCFFNVVNLKEGIPGICCPPDNVPDTSGLSQFVTEGVKNSDEQGKGKPAAQPQSTLSFGASQSSPFQQQTPTPPQASPFTTQPTQPQVPISAPFSNFGAATSNPKTTEAQTPFTNTSASLFATKSSENQPPFKTQQTPTPFLIGDTFITPATKVQTPTTKSEKYSSIFAALNAPSSTPLPHQSKQIPVSKLPQSSAASAPLPTKPFTSTPHIAKTSNMSGKPLDHPSKQSPDPKAMVDDKVKGETEALLAKMVKDECVALESELRALLHHGRKININIGSDVEKLDILHQIESLQQFINEIVDISLGENAEVHTLKQNLILSWAWYEEALSRYNVSKNETMNLLLKSQPLDSATEKRQADIKKLIYYLESQLVQVNRALDEQWDKFQDFAKKTHRVQMPTMEAIFQSMVSQNAILQRQTYLLKDISSRIKHKKICSSGPSLFLGLDENTRKIEHDLKLLQIEPDDPHRVLYEKSLNKTKHFTTIKRNKLRELLKAHDVVHVAAVKPQLNSILPFSPASRSKNIYSIIGAQMSPVQKAAVARNLDFSQSTPICENKLEMKPTSAPPNTPAQTESQKTFTFKNVEQTKSSTVATSGSSFLPTTKSVFSNFAPSTIQPTLPSSAPSAFVPTAQSVKHPSQTPEKANVGSSISTPSFSFPSTTFVPKTTEPLPTLQTSAAQFSFGSSITITPIKSAPVRSSTVDNKPGSTFTASSNSFESKSTPDVTVEVSKTTDLVSTPSVWIPPQTKSTSLFGIASTAPGTSFSFGSISGAVGVSSSESSIKTISVSSSDSSSTIMSKASEFSGAPSSTSVSSTVTETSLLSKTVTQPKSTIANTSFATQVTKPSLFGFSTANTVPTSVSKPTLFCSSTAATSVSTPATKPSLFSSNVTTSSVSSSGTPMVTTSIFGSTPAFGSVSTTNKSPSLFSTKPETTTKSEANSTSSETSAVTSSTPSSAAKTTPSTGVTNTSSMAGNSTITSTSGTITTSSTSIFGAAASVSSSVSTPTGSIFGYGKASTPSVFGSEPLKTAGTSVFGSGSTGTGSTSVFGVSPAGATSGTTSIFGGGASTASTSASIFATSTTSSTAAKPSIFGGSDSTSLFATNAASTTPASVFGGTIAQPSVFGTPASSTPTPVFGTTPVTTSQSSIFGTGGTPATQKGSIFGGGTTAQTSIFDNVTTASAQPSIFGSTTSAPTTQSVASTASSVFGTATTTTSSFGSAFGQPGSIFGTPKTTSSGFGSSFGGSSIFGSTPATTQAQGFGQPAFGSTPTPAFGVPTTSSSVFGADGSTFGSVSSSGNIFRESAASSTFSFASAAAGSAGGTGAFGFGNLNVGTAATTSSSIFGGGSTFGQHGAVTTPNPFGSGAGVFGSPSSTTSSIFGTNTSNAQSGFATSTFGSSPAFGQQSIFGQGQGAFGGTSFGSPQPGAFSAGGGGVGQSGFGSPAAFQKTSGFGSAPVFGGSPPPAFGASAGFGGAPAFGAAPAFGSPNKVFGSNTSTAAFGSASTGSPGFGNMATQNTVGFGNLAQQAATPNSTPFGGSPSFSSWR